MWHWRFVWGCLSSRDEYSSVAKNGPWQAAIDTELFWLWFWDELVDSWLSNPLRLLWCGQLYAFLRMVEDLLVFLMGYIRLSHSLTSDTLTSALLAVRTLARTSCRRSLCWLTEAVAVLCFSLCETGEHRVGQTASQLATASLEPDMSLLNPVTNTLQCIWISWKAKVGRLPKIHRNVLFLLHLLYPQRLFRCYLWQRSSWAHGFIACFLPPATFQCKGITVVSPPENGVCMFKRT